MSHKSRQLISAAVNRALANGAAPIVEVMSAVTEGYHAYTGHVFTASQADSYNAALAKFQRNPSEANANGCHNLFRTIVETPRAYERESV